MPESGSRAFFVVNLLMLQLRVFLSRMSHLRAFFCRECRDYALFGVEFYTEIWQKFSEILRILAERLRKKLATGASVLYLCLHFNLHLYLSLHLLQRKRGGVLMMQASLLDDQERVLEEVIRASVRIIEQQVLTW